MTIFSSLYGARLDEELGTDDATILFTTARRKNAINRGLQEFADLTECYVKWSTVTITSTANEFDLNLAITAFDYVRLAKTPVEFEYVDASSNVTVLAGQDDLPMRDVKWLDDNEPGWRNTVASTTQQMPQMMYVRADGASQFLGFWPPPSSGSSASMKVRIPYVAKPPVMSGAADVPYNGRADMAWTHQASVHYAAHQLEKLRRDTEASNQQLQKFLGYVSRFTIAMRKKGGNVVSQVRSYFTRGGFRNNEQGQDPRT